MINKIVENNIVRDIVKRAVTFETSGDTIAKISNGMVVKTPATLLLMSNTCFISPTTGPTEVKGARNVDAIKIIAKITPQFSFILCTL